MRLCQRKQNLEAENLNAPGCGACASANHPTDCQHNGHLYYILLKDGTQRNLLMNHLRQEGIQPATHYVPLHDSIAGQRFARTSGDLAVTCRVADTILRLPLFSELTESQIDFIGAEIEKFM